MTAKEKAKELIKKYYKYVSEFSLCDVEDEEPICINGGGIMKYARAKQCALIAVDEILNLHLWKYNSVESFNFWQEVKQEIENL